MERQSRIHIRASGRYGTLHVSVTSDPMKRVYQHRREEVAGFAERYGVHRLMWFEMHDDMPNAIIREKRLKAWWPKSKMHGLKRPTRSGRIG